MQGCMRYRRLRRRHLRWRCRPGRGRREHQECRGKRPQQKVPQPHLTEPSAPGGASRMEPQRRRPSAAGNDRVSRPCAFSLGASHIPHRGREISCNRSEDTGAASARQENPRRCRESGRWVLNWGLGGWFPSRRKRDRSHLAASRCVTSRGCTAATEPASSNHDTPSRTRSIFSTYFPTGGVGTMSRNAQCSPGATVGRSWRA
jgi:hypothetical protein